MQPKVLVIEDDSRMRKILHLILRSGGYDTCTAQDGVAGIEAWGTFQPDLVFTDLKMPRADGWAVLDHGKAHDPRTPVIILTAFGNIPDAVDAMKKGAFDYITKPVDNDLVMEKAQKALARSRKGGKELGPEPMLYGVSPAMAWVKSELNLVSRTTTSVLLTGASGTGKEVAARTIHQTSDRADGPMVKINCSAIPGELMESELFGHRRGAFTGATRNRRGAFVRADGGSLFLDEIGDLPLSLQPKLLHAVEDKVITPVGGSSPLAVDVKIISATNQALKEMVAKGKFRSDLYYRLNTYAVAMPALGERPQDIPELAVHFLDRIAREFDQAPPSLETGCMERLQQYDWPGNVRELKNILERLVLMGRGENITLKMVASVLGGAGMTPARREKPLMAAEREMIVQALESCAWNRSRAARQLGITRNTLRYRIQKFKITQGSGFKA